MKPQQPPDDTLLWRVETDHTEVVCFIVAAPDSGVALCVERNEELMVAESYALSERAIESAQELRAALGAIGLPEKGTTDAVAAETARPAALLAYFSEPDQGCDRGSRASCVGVEGRIRACLRAISKYLATIHY
jgi:hypothetical protein